MMAAQIGTPRSGDIIVQKSHASAVHYVLSTFEGASQLLYEDHNEAIRHASAGARKDQVNAWFTEDGHSYRPIAQYRPPLRSEK
jgi:hypothetical protein